MAFTGQSIVDVMPINESSRSDAEDLLAVQYAVQQAWPTWRRDYKQEDAFTLVGGTEEYVVSGTLQTWESPDQLHTILVNGPNNEFELTRWKVEFGYKAAGPAYQIRIPRKTSYRYAGLTTDLIYDVPISLPTTLAEDVDYRIPRQFMMYMVQAWYAQKFMSTNAVDHGRWVDIYETSITKAEDLRGKLGVRRHRPHHGGAL